MTLNIKCEYLNALSKSVLFLLYCTTFHFLKKTFPQNSTTAPQPPPPTQYSKTFAHG